MTTLLVTPFAPYRDGIAAYALQELRRLRQQGETVEVLSPVPSAARHHLPLGGPRGMAMLASMAGEYDQVVIQFSPEMLFGRCRSAAQRTAVWAGLAAVCRRSSVDIRLHEVEYGPLQQNPMERRAAAVALGQAGRVTVHTPAEREALNDHVKLGRRVEVVDHGRDFTPAVVRTKTEARAELSLADDRFVFLAIGFLQHHKGFDLAVEAVDRLPGLTAHLHVVGSARVDHPDIAGYVEQLRVRCSTSQNATLHQRFVSDVEFDLWLQAADAVVLPYREIWSSGVVERARLFNVPVVASDLPELRDQAPDGTVFFTDVDGLAVAMEKLVAESGLGSPKPMSVEDGVMEQESTPWTVDLTEPDRSAIERQIVARARSAQLDGTGADPAAQAGGAVDPLLSLGPLSRPHAISARPGVTPVKRAIQRMIAWQIDPLATQLEGLQRATIAAVARLDDEEPEGKPARTGQDEAQS